MTHARFKTDVDILEIKRMLPHRYPFLLIDKVTDMVASESALGHKNVTANEPHFVGHFPDKPIMPGVLIVEALAQTAGVLVVNTLDLMDKNMLVYFMSVDGAKFRQPVVPGDCLKLDVNVLRARKNVWRFSGAAKVEGKTVCECEYTAMIVPPEDA